MINTKVICLGALILRDCTGYDIRKMCEDGELKLVNYISYGSIYPTLKELEGQGLATFRKEKQKGKPDKKVFSITDEGRKYFKNAINEDLLEDKFRSEHLFALLFGDELDIKTVEKILNSYKSIANANCYNYGEHAPDTAGVKLIKGISNAAYKAILDYIEENQQEYLKRLSLKK